MNKKFSLIVATCLGIFLCMLDTTIMNIAIPEIQNGLNTQLNNLSWALNVYTIIFATSTISLSKIAEIIGISKTYIIGILIFMSGSLVSACASTVNILICGRAIQSFGAAIIFPLSMTIAIASVEQDDRTKVISALGITQGLAAALGPLIGGILTQYLSWRWIFLINLPLMVVALMLCAISLNFQERHKRQTIDVWGALLSMICLFSLSIVLEKGRVWGWGSPAVAIFSVSFLIALVGFIFQEKRTKNPMIPLELFKDTEFGIASVLSVISNLFLVAITVIMPTYFIQIQGKSELAAALLITPITFMIFIIAPISAMFVKKIGVKTAILGGFGSMCLAYLLLSFINLNNQTMIVVACLLLGFGYGAITGPVTVFSASNFTEEKLTISQSVVGVFRQVGIMLAVAIYVSGLYANINNAKAHSESCATTVIKKMALPEEAKTKILNITTASIEKGQEQRHLTHTSTGMPIEKYIDVIKKQTKMNMNNAFQKLYLWSLPTMLIILILLAVFLKVST